MNPMLSWGLSVVRFTQIFTHPALTLLMQGFTLAGSRLGYLALIPLVYWCVDKRRGLRIGMLVFFSSAQNQRLKSLFAEPRPFDLDPGVGMAGETDVDQAFGFPSGHAQTSAVLSGSIIRFFKKPWTRIIPLAYPLLVGLSRIYFGVHFPTDVLAGWAVGAALVCLESLTGDRIEKALSGLPKLVSLAAVAAGAFLIAILSTAEPSLAGAFFGLAGAAIFAKKTLPFSIAGIFGKKAMRFLLGMAIVIPLFLLPTFLPAGLEAAASS